MMSYNALRIAIMVALVALASYIVGFYTTGLFHGATAGIGGLWSAISGIVVLQATRHAAWSSA